MFMHSLKTQRPVQRAALLLFSFVLGAALMLLPNAGQAAAPPSMRQAGSPLATPTATEETAEETEAAPGSAQASQVLTRVESSALRSSQPMSVTLTGEADESNLRTFVSYMLSGYAISGSQITVTLGAQPAEWPLALSLPEGAEVAGGYVRRGEYEENVIFVQGDVLAEAAAGQETASEDQTSDTEERTGQDNVGEAAAQLVSTLRESLMADGYIAPPDEMYGGTLVFLPTTASMPDLLCDADGNYIVSLGAIAVYGEPPAVRISLSPEQNSDLCSGQSRQGESPLLTMLPQLTPPADAEVMPHGTGMGSDQVEVDARITSDKLTAADLAEHYEAQLVDAGWENLGRAATDPIAWSSWSFQDPDGNGWTATFTVVQQGGDATSFEASLSVERTR